MTLTAAHTVADEIVAPRAPWSKIVRAGDVLTIVDLHGNQAVDTLLLRGGQTTACATAPRPPSRLKATSS